MTKCAIVNCPCRSNRCRGLSFHRIFRRNYKEWEQYLIKITNQGDNLSRNAKICSRHFEDNCFEGSDVRKRILKAGSVPTKFLPDNAGEVPEPLERKPPLQRQPLSLLPNSIAVSEHGYCRLQHSSAESPTCSTTSSFDNASQNLSKIPGKLATKQLNGADVYTIPNKQLQRQPPSLLPKSIAVPEHEYCSLEYSLADSSTCGATSSFENASRYISKMPGWFAMKQPYGFDVFNIADMQVQRCIQVRSDNKLTVYLAGVDITKHIRKKHLHSVIDQLSKLESCSGVTEQQLVDVADESGKAHYIVPSFDRSTNELKKVVRSRCCTGIGIDLCHKCRVTRNNLIKRGTLRKILRRSRPATGYTIKKYTPLNTVPKEILVNALRLKQHEMEKNQADFERFKHQVEQNLVGSQVPCSDHLQQK